MPCSAEEGLRGPRGVGSAVAASLQKIQAVPSNTKGSRSGLKKPGLFLFSQALHPSFQQYLTSTSHSWGDSGTVALSIFMRNVVEHFPFLPGRDRCLGEPMNRHG